LQSLYKSNLKRNKPMSSNSSNKISNDPFAPWDQDAHSRDMCDEKTDVFNRVVDEVAQHPGGLRRQLEALANSDHPEVAQVLADAGIENPRIRRKFYLSDGAEGAIFADDAGWHAQIVIGGQTLTFTAGDKDDAMAAAERHAISLRGPHFKTLDEGQLLNIARLAQNGSWQEAIGTFLYFRLGDVVTDQHPEQIASNPKWLPVMNEAVYYVWRHTNNAYVGTPEAEAALARFAGDRPLTMQLCNAWWLAYQELGERRAAQAPAPENERQPAPTAEEIQQGLESLSDEAIEKLRTQALKHRGHAIRRFDERMRGQ
jgi:hypothetical protein